jgi:disulfide bond formation protein DsbB
VRVAEDRRMTNLAKARIIAVLVPLALLAGALGSQYVGGLYPCEMCYWQRWPHEVGVVSALFAIALADRHAAGSRWLTLLAGAAILLSGLIGAFHAGVEYGWWQGLTTCSTTGAFGASSSDILADIMAAPIVRCDQAQWELFGISLAGYNAIFSIATAIAIFILATGSTRDKAPA